MTASKITLLYILTWIGLVSTKVNAEYDCNVCQKSNQGERSLANPSAKFTLPNGITWSCGQLQTMVQDVYPSMSAFDAQHCRTYQIFAEMFCECNGPEVASLINGPYKDLHPSCDLCSGGDFPFVPAFKTDETVKTMWYVILPF
jgi:hypothetical protein